MDRTDETILSLLQGNARMTFQELGDAIGMSRVAAKKRVQKLEEAGVIRGYNTAFYREGEVTMFIDLITAPERLEEVEEYLCTRTAYIRQIYRTELENHLRMIAVADSVHDLNYLAKMIQKQFGDGISYIKCRVVEEIIKDVYGGIRKYERRTIQDYEEDHELH